MRGRIKGGEIGLMTRKAVLSPNEIGIGNIRWHSKHRIRRDARNPHQTHEGNQRQHRAGETEGLSVEQRSNMTDFPRFHEAVDPSPLIEKCT